MTGFVARMNILAIEKTGLQRVRNAVILFFLLLKIISY